MGEEADLYALALVLYEALSGVNPVRGRGAAATARRVGARLPALGRLRRDLPLELCRALDRAVLARPEQRGTLADLRAALADALPVADDERGTIAGSPLEGLARRAPAPGSARARAVAAALAAGALAAAALALADARRAGPTVSPAAGAAAAALARAAGAAAGLDRAGRRRWRRGRAARPRSSSALAALPTVVLLRRAGDAVVAARGRAAAGRRGPGRRVARAGRRRPARPWQRAALGALGAWWLALAEVLTGDRLALGRPARQRAGRRAPRPAADERRAGARRALGRSPRSPCPSSSAAGSSPPTSSAPRRGRRRSDPPRRPSPVPCPGSRRCAAWWPARSPRAASRSPSQRHGARRTGVPPRSITAFRRDLGLDARAVGHTTPPMSLLRNLEDKIAGLVEGTFGRVFRTQVRPVEIARKLAREMDEHKTVSVSRTYVPNEYVVWLGTEDRQRFEGVEHEVIDELSAYLLEHARREKLALVSRPQINFDTDERLRLGEFGIQARLVRAAARGGASRPTTATRWSTRPRPARRRSCRTRAAARRGRAMLLAEGKRYAVGPGGATIGRSRECDIVLADSNVSRRHAELRPLRRRLDASPTWARPTACASTGATCAPTSRSRCSPATASTSAPSTRASRSTDARRGGRADLRRPAVRLPRRALPLPAVGLAQRPARPAQPAAALRERARGRRRARRHRPARRLAGAGADRRAASRA